MIENHGPMTLCVMFYELCEILALDHGTATCEEVIETVEQLMSLALTGELPERWTITEGKERETPMRNVQ